MLKIIFFGVAILIAFFIYRIFIGPSKLEREIKKQGGFHPCFYCKKTIHINEEKRTYRKKPNYKAVRKGRIKYFLVTKAMYIFALTKHYRFLFPQ